MFDRLLDALEGSPLWRGFLLARQAGAWLVGSSAGAMALGDWALVHRPEDGHGTPTLWMPGLGMLRKYGTVAASPENARKALRAGAAVLVYPGGDYEVHRPIWERHRIDFDGRNIPVTAIIGVEFKASDVKESD